MRDLRPFAALARSIHRLEETDLFQARVVDAIEALLPGASAAVFASPLDGPGDLIGALEAAVQWASSDHRPILQPAVGGTHVLAPWNGKAVPCVFTITGAAGFPEGFAELMGETFRNRREALRAGTRGRMLETLRQNVFVSKNLTLGERVEQFVAAATEVTGVRGALMVVVSATDLPVWVRGDGLRPRR